MMLPIKPITVSSPAVAGAIAALGGAKYKARIATKVSWKEPKAPNSRPPIVTPPFVPRGTRFQGAVIKKGVVCARIPSSEENVSAATAAYCATIPMGRSFCRVGRCGPAPIGRFDEIKGVLLSR